RLHLQRRDAEGVGPDDGAGGPHPRRACGRGDRRSGDGGWPGCRVRLRRWDAEGGGPEDGAGGAHAPRAKGGVERGGGRGGGRRGGVAAVWAPPPTTGR